MSEIESEDRGQEVGVQEEHSDVPSGGGDPGVDSPAESLANDEAIRISEEAGAETPDNPVDAE